MSNSLRQTRTQRLRVSQRLSTGTEVEATISFSRQIVKVFENYLAANQGWDIEDQRRTIIHLKSMCVYFSDTPPTDFPATVAARSDTRNVVERVIIQRFNEYLEEARLNRYFGFKSNMWFLNSYFGQKLEKIEPKR